MELKSRLRDLMTAIRLRSGIATPPSTVGISGRLLRRWRADPSSCSFIEPRPRTPRGVEQAARFLVQKIARENAAQHAFTVRRAMHQADIDHGSTLSLYQLRRRADQAKRIRDAAVLELRLELGLSDHPSAIEVSGWGEAP